MVLKFIKCLLYHSFVTCRSIDVNAIWVNRACFLLTSLDSTLFLFFWINEEILVVRGRVLILGKVFAIFCVAVGHREICIGGFTLFVCLMYITSLYLAELSFCENLFICDDFFFNRLKLMRLQVLSDLHRCKTNGLSS